MGANVMKTGRRIVLKGAAAGLVSLAAPWIASAATGPMRVGFLTVKTGPLASGGLQMEQGLTLYLKERNNVLAGRPVQLFTGDSAGAPAHARTQSHELGGRRNASGLNGPPPSAAAASNHDHNRDQKIPALGL